MASRKRPTYHANRARALGLACLGLALGGCSHVYSVRVDALRTPELAPRRSYHLVASDPGLSANDPTFAEACATVGRALESHGLFAASRPEWADMVIELDYGIGQRRLISVPDASARDAGVSTVFLPDRSGDTVGTTTGTQVPSTAFTRLVPVFEKHLSLVARENGTAGTDSRQGGAELWRVDVSVQDATASIDDLIPVLAAALIDSIDIGSSRPTIKRISAVTAAAFVVSQVN